MAELKSGALSKFGGAIKRCGRDLPYLNLIIPIIRKHGLYKYKSYDEYKDVQIEANLAKINNCWATDGDIALLSNYLNKNVPNLKFGICHGTRRGREQEWFRKHLKIDVIGTEISPTATQFPHTIEWDFHDVKDEWINNVDFIYSNSFDHSYQPVACLDAWMSCITTHGACVLEWTRSHKYPTKTDPFGGGFEYYKTMIERKYHIKDIIEGHYDLENKLKRFFFVITHRNWRTQRAARTPYIGGRKV